MPLPNACHLCWLKKRHEEEGGKIDVCFATAFNLGRLHVSGLIVTMCADHVALIEKSMGDLHDAVEAGAPEEFDA
jgi:hypothetical protein